MPAEVCFNSNGEWICIPLYVQVERRFGPEPDPRLVGGIDLGELIQPDDRRVTAGWIEAIGLDQRQQRQLAAMVQIADAATALPGNVALQVNAIMQEQLAGLKTAEGVALHLDIDRQRDASAA